MRKNTNIPILSQSNYLVVILAAGKSERFGGGSKVFSRLGEKEVLNHSLDFFLSQIDCHEIILVMQKRDFPKMDNFLKKKQNKRISLVTGGKSRASSVMNALELLKTRKIKKNSKILVHNAANPFLSVAEIENLKNKKNAILARKINGTLKQANEESNIINSQRGNFYCAETPQISTWENLWQSYKKYPDAPDESQALQKNGIPVEVIETSKKNYKITTKEDLLFANQLLNKKKEMRIGIGEDAHRFATLDSEQSKAPLVLGGITFPGHRGLEANSDGDVIIHALCNAIRSALGKTSFSDVADKLLRQGEKNSCKYLEVILSEEKMIIKNISIAIECKTPRLESKFNKIKEKLASLLSIESQQIGITVTSGEELTACGRGEGIAVRALVYLEV